MRSTMRTSSAGRSPRDLQDGRLVPVPDAGQHQVRRLNVTVNHAVLVSLLQADGGLPRDFTGIGNV